jgi:hypothetical protein
MVRLNADVPDELRKRLLHALVDEDISFAEWLRRQIEAYLQAKEAPTRRRRPGIVPKPSLKAQEMPRKGKFIRRPESRRRPSPSERGT